MRTWLPSRMTSARGCKVAKRSEGVLGLAFLVDRDADDDDDEGHQDRAVQGLGEEEIDGSGAEEEQQHRLPDDVPGLIGQVPGFRGWELVRAVGGEVAILQRKQFQRNGG
ncbi:hypothetical protein RCH16_002924 [Cryobacterium sp. MP_M5]|nr:MULTISPECIES: hypothetical protein [unclassified Cryobacterium]MBG6060124.1 hypothetical protein [Cryobacterium sp. MP_M3]MEC5177898.1 hypothetical protein [Cryobacterium sp. MP_M5]